MTDKKTAATLDTILRSHARAELEKDIRAKVDKAFERITTSWHVIDLDHEDLKITVEDTASISTRGLKEVLVRAILAYSAPNVEQSAVLEFIARVNQVGDDIDELRGEVRNMEVN